MAEGTPIFSYGEAVTAGWELTKKHWRFILLYFGVLIGLEIVSTILGGNAKNPSVFGSLVAMVIGLVTYVVAFAFSRAGVRLVDGQTVEAKDLFWFDLKAFLSFFAGSVLFGLMVVFGLLLFIVPGVIVLLMFSQYALLIAQKQLGPIEALKESKRLTDGHKWRLLGWFLVEIAILIGGLMLFLVGIVVAVPVVMMGQFWVYATLRDAAGKPAIGAPATAKTK